MRLSFTILRVLPVNGKPDLKRFLHALTVIITTLALAGCGTFGYYRQAVGGHWDVMSRRVPLDELIEAPDTNPELKRKLVLVSAARKFAQRELLLPDNGSYRSYADLEREYVVWNVFAAPELSLAPITSCFVFVGCLSYRGFFDEARARRFGDTLRAAGNDVFVGGVAAYSTLGWFDDPVLNTMLVWDDIRIVKVIFHELAHQLVYAENDTVFNESFATAVAEFGVARWLERDEALKHRYAAGEAREREFLHLLLDYRVRLEAAYAGPGNDDTKRQLKKNLFDELSSAYRTLKNTWGGYDGYDEWMAEDLNNAKLSSIATYHDYVPAFRAILSGVEYDIGRFYAIVETLASMSLERREQCLGGTSETAGRGAACSDDLINGD